MEEFNFGAMGDDVVAPPDDTGIAAASGAPVDGAVVAGESGGGECYWNRRAMVVPAGRFGEIVFNSSVDQDRERECVHGRNWYRRKVLCGTIVYY